MTDEKQIVVPSKLRRNLFILGFLLVGLVGLLFFNPYSFKMTMSESVDHSLFLVKRIEGGSINRGQYVSVLAPDKPGSGQEYVKLVAGIAGDEVNIEGRDVYVAGVYRGRAKEISLKGESLSIVEPGIIPDGHIYLFAPHKDSFDSRYKDIGFVPESLVQGIARPIL